MIPNNTLPDVAGRIARILPATHAMNALEGLAMGFEPAFSAWGSITVLLVSGVLGFALAIYLFNWDSKNRTRRGYPIIPVVVLVPYIVSMFL